LGAARYRLMGHRLYTGRGLGDWIVMMMVFHWYVFIFIM
jgi:hypothetical protein